ncbi:MAG: glycosyltransferase family 2 protein [Proteobacteria bacterium]|nr:glycosyltransferase family 2 protein [Pseudomonadota bacterium]MBU1738396.1 glycosyltransferase family 2 protein [Pseudomonadota bacterium]
MKLTVIIPVYNERQTFAEIMQRVVRVPLFKEIIVVDDGSNDGTRELLSQYVNQPNIKVIFHKSNLGKGHAIRTGLAEASGEIVVIQDADLEYDPEDFVEMIKPIRNGQTAVVYGSRRLKKENKSYSGWIYYIGGLTVTYLACFLYRISITDEATCYKMMDTALLRSLNLTCERFEFCPEVTAKLALLDIPILEVPISYYPRNKSEGKKIGWRDAVEAIWTLLKLKLSPVKIKTTRGEC